MTNRTKRMKVRRRIIERNEQVLAKDVERKRLMPTPEVKPDRDGYRDRLTRKADRILKGQ